MRLKIGRNSHNLNRFLTHPLRPHGGTLCYTVVTPVSAKEEIIEYSQSHRPVFRRYAGSRVELRGGRRQLYFVPGAHLYRRPPINANATNTVALWPGSVASVGAYRREL